MDQTPLFMNRGTLAISHCCNLKGIYLAFGDIVIFILIWFWMFVLNKVKAVQFEVKHGLFKCKQCISTSYRYTKVKSKYLFFKEVPSCLSVNLDPVSVQWSWKAGRLPVDIIFQQSCYLMEDWEWPSYTIIMSHPLLILPNNYLKQVYLKTHLG